MTSGQEDVVGAGLEDVLVGILGTTSQEEVQQSRLSLQCNARHLLWCYLYSVLSTALPSEEGPLSAMLHHCDTLG